MIPRVFAPIKKGDFTITPITVHKKYVIQRSDLFSGTTPNTGSGYKLLEAVYPSEPLKLGTNRVYPTNSFDGSYQHIVWKQLDAMYYRYPTFSEGSNERYTFKFLNFSASILQIPQHDFGEGIKPGSVEITGSVTRRFSDDGHGNLYLTTIDTGSFTNRKNLAVQLGFDDSFRLVKNSTDSYTGNLSYTSYTFSPDKPVLADNIVFSDGLPIDGTYTGKSAYFDGSSSLLVPHRAELDFGKDYTISFWIRPDLVSPATIFSKRGTLTKHIRELDGSYRIGATTEIINVYPFDIYYESENLKFCQNDGTGVATLHTINIPADGSWYHIAFVCSGSISTSYLDGSQWSTTSTKSVRNSHDIVIGTLDIEYTDSAIGRTQFAGYLDEIRIYDRGLTSSEVQTLGDSDSADQRLYQTAIMGNIFYKTGTIVLSTRDTRYSDLFDLDFTLKYRNTHTIYQYETLCRIKKGDFNLSQNPTARQSPYSDLLINEMTSSVEDGGMPTYFNSVGLYNDAGELLVVGKMGQNIRNRDDVDLNLIIRWDC